MNARRDGGAPHYVLEEREESRTENRMARGSGESQEGLTKVHEVTLVAKVASERMV